MSHQLFLRIPNEIAKKQIEARISAWGDGFHYDHNGNERLRWHQANISTLKIIFASDEVANEYNDIVRRMGAKDISYNTASLLREFLKQLKDSVAGFPVLPADTRVQSSGPVAPQTSSPTAVPVSPVRWEFGTIEVETPSREAKYAPTRISGTGVVEGHFNMEKTLEMLAAEGWDIFAVLPSYQETSHDHIFITSYRLFFKRPAP